MSIIIVMNMIVSIVAILKNNPLIAVIATWSNFMAYAVVDYNFFKLSKIFGSMAQKIEQKQLVIKNEEKPKQ